MVTPLPTTRLYIPPPQPNLVPRPCLIKRLDEGLRLGHRLTLVSAPAVIICCGDYDGQTSPGSLCTESLAALLSSERAQAVREEFERMRIVRPYCQKCIGGASRVRAMVKGLISVYLFKLLNFQPAARMKEVPLIRMPSKRAAGLSHKPPLSPQWAAEARR